MSNDALLECLQPLDKDDLVAALIGGIGLPKDLRGEIPRLPSNAVQMSTNGKTGYRNIVESVDFCTAVMQRYRAQNRDPHPRVMDFGCGWGRITRTFLGVTPADRITGVDVRQEAVDLAASLAPRLTFTRVDPTPPAPQFADGSFDLVVAYSVFSHLSEDTAQAWIGKFGRIVAPGGLLCLTTRPRVYLVNARTQAANAADLTGTARQYATLFDDFDAAIARYDAGEFVYAPTGGGGTLTPDFFGEAVVPRAYVEAHWQKDFEMIEWVDTFSDIGTQPLLILRRRA